MIHVQELARLLHIAKRQKNQADAEIINRAAIVFIVAAWQAYVEHVAIHAFSHLLDTAPSHSVFPPKVRVLAAGKILESKDQRAVWELADTGWRDVLKRYQQSVIEKFNTPNSRRIDELFESTIGLERVSQYWRWRGMTPDRARERLNTIVDLRHEIAHTTRRARASVRGVSSATALEYSYFVHRLAVCLHNSTEAHLVRVTGKKASARMRFTGKLGVLS